MVAIKLILQTLAGVVAVGGAVGGTVALSNNTATTQTEKPAETSTVIKQQAHNREGQIHYPRQERTRTEVVLNSSNQTTKAFYLVSSAITIADSIPEKELFDGENSTNKNYQCINISQGQGGNEKITKDTSCVFYSLNNTNNESLKTSEIKGFIQNTTQLSQFTTKVTQKSQLQYNKFFLLEGNKDLIQFSINNRQQTIYLTKKDTTNTSDPSNYYLILIVHAKISSNEVTGTTNTVIAKATGEQQAKNTPGNNSTTSHQCSFKTDNSKTNCKLSKLSQYTTTTSSFNFASEAIKSRLEPTSTELNSYYLIESDGIKAHEAKELKASKVTYIKTQTQNSKTTTPLTVEAAVFIKLNNDRSKLAELIILDQ